MLQIRRDDGFSLTEMVIVLALMGFVLSIAYGLLRITNIGAATTNREAWMAREVAAPLEFAERVLSQQIGLDTNTGQVNEWRCAFFTQRGGEEAQQRYVIEVPSSPSDHRLLVTFDQGDGGTIQPVAWSTANFNREAGVPLFTYFDADGAVLPSPVDVHRAFSVQVTIVTEHEGRRFSDSRTVLFRNR